MDDRITIKIKGLSPAAQKSLAEATNRSELIRLALESYVLKNLELVEIRNSLARLEQRLEVATLSPTPPQPAPEQTQQDEQLQNLLADSLGEWC